MSVPVLSLIPYVVGIGYCGRSTFLELWSNITHMSISEPSAPTHQ